MTAACSLSKVELKKKNKTFNYANCRIYYGQLGEDIWEEAVPNQLILSADSFSHVLLCE